MKRKTYWRVGCVMQAVHDVLSCKDVVIECDDSYAHGTVVFQDLEDAVHEACAALYPKRTKLPEKVIALLSDYVEGVFDRDFPELDFPSKKGVRRSKNLLEVSSVMLSELENFVSMCDRKYFSIECAEEPEFNGASAR